MSSLGRLPPPGTPQARFLQNGPGQQARRILTTGPASTSLTPRANTAPKKKKRCTEKYVSSRVQELVPEAQAYLDLITVEQKIDLMINRKKLDIQESLKRPMKAKRKLRIFISHTFFPGREPEKEGDEPIIPMWELRVEGRLLEEAQPGQISAASSRSLPKRKFSSYFKSLVIELEKDIYGPDNHLVEWHRTPQTGETDGFQVKRPGNKPVKCTILLLLDHQPMKFKLHARLAKLLGIATETRPKIIEALWQYIKAYKLQDPIDADSINNDVFLEQIFGCKRMRVLEIPQRLHALLQQPDPVVLHHTIEQKEGGNNTACYDIEVEVDDHLKQHFLTFMQLQSNNHDIYQLDQRIYDLVDQANELQKRRDFFKDFSENPNRFISRWIEAQTNELKRVSEQHGEIEEEKKAETYLQPNIPEAVHRHYYAKIQQRRHELEQSLGLRHN
ncbi:unnamed protein product, partial [Mesorhabditis spiculigera]